MILFNWSKWPFIFDCLSVSDPDVINCKLNEYVRDTIMLLVELLVTLKGNSIQISGYFILDWAFNSLNVPLPNVYVCSALVLNISIRFFTQ